MIKNRDYPPQFYRLYHEKVRRSAERIVPILLELLSPRSVVDVGCGSGSWLAVFEEHGVGDYLGIEADWIDKRVMEISPDRILTADLERPLGAQRQFDLVLSLEVGEHLAPASAETFVESLTSLGPAVLFSAAIPFQGGEHHVNEQWPEYWAAKFREKGFVVVDCIRKRVWNDPQVAYWYAQNTLLFVRDKILKANPRLQKEGQNTVEAQLSVVHPQRYVQAANAAGWTVPQWFWNNARWLEARHPKKKRKNR